MGGISGKRFGEQKRGWGGGGGGNWPGRVQSFIIISRLLCQAVSFLQSAV